jgi:mono/diheme cytochrome c family protein
MRKFSYRRIGLLFFAGWMFWVIGNLFAPQVGKNLMGSQAFAGFEKPADGIGVYRQFCLNCHAANGKGDDTMKKVMTAMPDFTSEKWQKETSDAQMAVSITDGKNTLMPAFADKVDGDQVQALIEYIRKFDASRVK